MALIGKTVFFSITKTEVTTVTRNQNGSIIILLVKRGQAARAMEVLLTSFDVKLNPIICLCCVCPFVYVVYDNLYILCMRILSLLRMKYFDYSFLSILCMTLSLTSTFSIYYIIHFILFSQKQNFSPNCCAWSCWS